MEPIPPEAYLAIAAGAHKAVTKYKDRRVYKKNEKIRKLESGSTSTGWTSTTTTDASSTSSSRSLEELLDQNGLVMSQDGYLEWSMSSPDYPRNWGSVRKMFDLGLLVWLGFLMAMGSSVGTPASSYALQTFHVSKTVAVLGFTTIYLIGQGLGSLLFSPYAEAFGRKRLYIASALLYSIFCIPVAATPNIAAVFIGRFITGAVSAVSIVLIRGSIGDVLDGERRSWALFISSLVSNFGLIIGPIFASYIAIALNWRWVFYLTSIITISTSLLLLTTHETHPSLLLTHKVALLQNIRTDLILQTQPLTPVPDLRTSIHLSLLRPLHLFFTEPIILLTSLTSAFATALLYLLPAALPLIYSAHPFHFSPQRATLLFLFAAIGLALSTLTRFYDRHILRKTQRANLPFSPEKNLSSLILSAPLLAIALWWFAWSVPPKAHSAPWPASAISLIFHGYAISEIDINLTRYLTESYPAHTSTAFIPLLFLRAIFSGVFPLFTTPLYKNLNNNTAGVILAALATLFCLVPLVLVMYGKRIRGGSRVASEGMAVEEREELVRIRTEKEERNRVEREVGRRERDEAVARGVDLGGMSSDSFVRNLSGVARAWPGVVPVGFGV